MVQKDISIVSTAMILVASSAIADSQKKVEIISDFNVDDSILAEIDIILEKKVSKDSVNKSFENLIGIMSFEDKTLFNQYFAEFDKAENGVMVADTLDSTILGSECQVARSCYSNCYGQCHNACHGSRGWR